MDFTDYKIFLGRDMFCNCISLKQVDLLKQIEDLPDVVFGACLIGLFRRIDD